MVSGFERPSTGRLSGLGARLSWALDDEVVEGWGTGMEWLVGGVWMMWLGLLAVKDTGDGM